MNEGAALRRLRTFLQVLAVAFFVGAIGELLAAKHYESAVQLIPFGLCGLGVGAVLALRRHPTPAVIRAIRSLMIVIAIGSLFGIFEHVAGNIDFVRETRPHAGTMTLVIDTLQGGVPILAPGVLVVGAAVTWAATFASGVLAVRSPLPAELRAERTDDTITPAWEPARR